MKSGSYRLLKLRGGIRRCALCGSPLQLNLYGHPHCTSCGFKSPVEIEISHRRRKRTYARYEKASYHLLLNQLARVLRQDYGFRVYVESYRRSRYLVVNNTAVVMSNAMWPLKNINLRLIDVALQRHGRAIFASSTWIQPQALTKLSRMGVKAVKTSICYRKPHPRLMGAIRAMARELCLLGVRVAVRFTLKAAKAIAQQLVHALFRGRLMKARGLKVPSHYEVKGLATYTELHIHHDGVYLCELYGLAWVIKRLTKEQLEGLLTTRRLREIDKPLCRGELAPEGFNCP